MKTSVRIVGADANNLKNIDVTFPARGVSMVVGVSGSGKSSLLSATLAAEGERRLRTYLALPAVEDHDHVSAFVGPLAPTIHVGQRTFRASIRTTVGTSSGLLALLRRLFLACSVPWSDTVGSRVPGPSPETYAAWTSEYHRGKATIWAVPVRLEQTDGVRQVASLSKAGVKEIVIYGPRRGAKDTQGRRLTVSAFRPLSRNELHTIEADLGTVEVRGRADAANLLEVLQKAFDAGGGKVVVELHGSSHPDVQSDFGPRLDSNVDWVISGDERVYAPASRPLLSFNAPAQARSGACKLCAGTGRAAAFRETLLVVRPERSMHAGAFALWTEKNYKHVNIQHETIEGLRGLKGFDPDVPWKKLPAAAKDLVLNGTDEPVIDLERKTGRKLSARRRYHGFRRAIVERVAKGGRAADALRAFVNEGPCPECRGSRWSHQARALRIGDLGIDDFLGFSFSELATYTASAALGKAAGKDGRGIVRALDDQAEAFVRVGLSHLSGDRGMLDVSEGESRRTRLAGVLNAHEQGLVLLLDEPARGLHDQDLAGMADVLRTLGEAHTVICNEHRTGLARAAAHLLEMGPGAGAAGGGVTFSGPMRKGRWGRPEPLTRRQLAVKQRDPRLVIAGATLHNLEGIEVSLPLGRLTCLTGISGSGKSNFARGILVPAIAESLGITVAREDFDTRPGQWTRVSGEKRIKGLVALDHRPPPPNRRSTVLTFLGIADGLRKTFAGTPSAKTAGLTPSDFGLNSGRGRCPTCLGIGETEEEGSWVSCSSCGGSGYSQAVLAPHVDGLSIRDVLALPVSELLESASWLGKRREILDAMSELGIGHVALGRRLDSMSGGEVQRLRIAQRLVTEERGSLLFVLDEPAAGLHPDDVRRLLAALDRILAGGRNTIVLVEHNIQIVRAADWVIEFGPGTGLEGGKVVARGSPATIARTKTATGKAVRGGDGKATVPRRPAIAKVKARPSKEMARRVITAIRRLRGDDVGVAEEGDDERRSDRPVMVLSPEFVAGRRLHEIADLDLELADVLLEAHRDGRDEATQSLATTWRRKGGWLALQPLIGDLQDWGDVLPRSLRRDLKIRLRAADLRLVDLRGRSAELSVDWKYQRATADRFVSTPKSEGEATAAVTEAMALGGGYVELRSSDGNLIGSATDRLLDLDHGLVGPFASSPEHFSRHHDRGRCPACHGAGTVDTVNPKFVIANERVAPTDERFLTKPAAKVLKGALRRELHPLLKRLASEGLLNRPKETKSRDGSVMSIVRDGYWRRPGHGTFVRNRKADPSEVGAWIRWDGLFAQLLQDLGRSDDSSWRASVEESRSRTECRTCGGTGHNRYGRLLHVGGEPLTVFVSRRTVRDLDKELARLAVGSERQKLRLDRIRECLEPATRAARAHPLREMPKVDLALRIAERCTAAFTGMPIVRV